MAGGTSDDGGGGATVSAAGGGGGGGDLFAGLTVHSSPPTSPGTTTTDEGDQGAPPSTTVANKVATDPPPPSSSLNMPTDTDPTVPSEETPPQQPKIRDGEAPTRQQQQQQARQQQHEEETPKRGPRSRVVMGLNDIVGGGDAAGAGVVRAVTPPPPPPAEDRERRLPRPPPPPLLAPAVAPAVAPPQSADQDQHQLDDDVVLLPSPGGTYPATLRLLTKLVDRSREHLPYDESTNRIRTKLGPASWLFGGIFGGRYGIDYNGGRRTAVSECVDAMNHLLEAIERAEESEAAIAAEENGVGGRGPGGGGASTILATAPGRSSSSLRDDLGVDVDEVEDAMRSEATARRDELVGAFVTLISTWCAHSSSSASSSTHPGPHNPRRERGPASASDGGDENEYQGEDDDDDEEVGGMVVSPPLLTLVIGTAERLVARGCLDHALGTRWGQSQYDDAVQCVSDAVCTVDQCTEEMELAALKFLLTTGCRVPEPPPPSEPPSSTTMNGDSSTLRTMGTRGAMLHGRYLLQLIRTAYRVYLRTMSEPNKTTARAALQQLVTSVFQRMDSCAAVGVDVGVGGGNNQSLRVGGSSSSADPGPGPVSATGANNAFVISEEGTHEAEADGFGSISSPVPREKERARVADVGDDGVVVVGPPPPMLPGLSSPGEDRDEATAGPGRRGTSAAAAAVVVGRCGGVYPGVAEALSFRPPPRSDGGGGGRAGRRGGRGSRGALGDLRQESFSASFAANSSHRSSPGQHFATPNHLDAFLVLRSLCKLSMKSVTDVGGTSGYHGHGGGGGRDGAASSVSSPTGSSSVAGGGAASTTAGEDASATGGTGDEDGAGGGGAATANPAPDRLATAPSSDSATVSVTGSDIGGIGPGVGGGGGPGGQNPPPALESKILGLELLLYVLEHAAPRAELFLDARFSFAIRHYLCVSLLKNCTSDDTRIVELSLRLFVPIIRHFRAGLKAEIEAFVTNVFFVILDSPNSTVEHKHLVVTLFSEICSCESTLAEIFLNYDCDLSAVDLFHRIVAALARAASKLTAEDGDHGGLFGGGAGAARGAALRQANRELRLNAMGALRQVLASLYATLSADGVVGPAPGAGAIAAAASYEDSASLGSSTFNSAYSSVTSATNGDGGPQFGGAEASGGSGMTTPPPSASATPGQKSLVEMYDSKKKLREREDEIFLRFNQKPSGGIKYAGQVGYIDSSSPSEVAGFLLRHKERLDKTQIGDYLGREADYQDGFCIRVLHEYVEMLEFTGLVFDDAIRHYLSGFRLPGEAQKIDRIMEKFAERFCLQNPNVFPTADAAFILAFSVIMLNTDLHNPAIKEERRMTREGFIRNNRGICDGGDLPAEFLNGIFDRIRSNPISLKEDDEAREKAAGGPGGENGSKGGGVAAALFFGNSSYEEIDRKRESKFLKERDQIVRSTEIIFQQRRGGGRGGRGKSTSSQGKLSSTHFVKTSDTGLRDEYVIPMFEVTWGPALAVFSTAMESACSSVNKLKSIATEEEIFLAIDNADATADVCLSGFRLAICTAGLCGNDTARGAFVHALLNFSRLGSGKLLEDRHIRCVQALLELAHEDGELLGGTWEHIFKTLAEVNRLHQVYDELVRAERSGSQLVEGGNHGNGDDHTDGSFDTDMDDFSSSDGSLNEDDMDRRSIDEANARAIYEAVPEGIIDKIYHRSSSLSHPAAKDFIFQLCRVSRMEISGYGGHVGSRANTVDLDAADRTQVPELLSTNTELGPSRKHQPTIYSLQKLVEVTHYNMECRPRIVFADMWTAVAGHLTSTALHSNPAVAMYAVDSFRQLSIQFLQREELGMFEFQRRFLKAYETVMERSCHASTKELLLSSVEQIILVFGESGSGRKDSSKARKSSSKHGTLRSGWKAILAVLGLAGQDVDDNVAQTGFRMLDGLVKSCVVVKERPVKRKSRSSERNNNGREKDQKASQRVVTSIVMMEHFVDLVDALLMYVSGPREDLTLAAMDHLVVMSHWLADDSIPQPMLRSRSGSFRFAKDERALDTEGSRISDMGEGRSRELELWWPILLGFSRSAGDARVEVREKCLTILLDTINTYFLPPPAEDKAAANETTDNNGKGNEDSGREGDMQTLRMIYKGILTPTLEHAEMDVNSIFATPQLPDDFTHFVAPSVSSNATNDAVDSANWLTTSLDPLLDGSVAICLRSIDVFHDDSLVEEVLGMLNSCLVSDSGALAVRGLRRLHLLITRDLRHENLTGDTWATACHMLLRCLVGRSVTSEGGDVNVNDEGADDMALEDNLLVGKRYIPSNAAMVIGNLLSDDKYAASMGLPWYLFLAAGLGRGIKEFERAASMGEVGYKQSAAAMNPPPPSHLENAVYIRKWMVRFVLALAGMDAVDENGQVPSTVQTVIKDETQSLLTAFLEKEGGLGSASSDRMSEAYRVAEVGHLTGLVCDLLGGFNKLGDDRLFSLPWLCPMLTALIESNNKLVRVSVHNLVSRMFEGRVAEKDEGSS